MPDSTTSRRPTVAIVYRSVFRYRLPFYEKLRVELQARGIDLILVYGQPGATDVKKNDTVDVPWGAYVPSRILRLGGREIYWQPVLEAVGDADLVIVEQATKLLVNYVLLAQQAFGKRKVAFWGHGRNFQSSGASDVGEWIKRLVSTKVHWWFAYNRTSAEVVEALGYPRERITNVRNAIDTRDLVEAADAVDDAAKREARREIGIQGRHVGVYVGGMYPEKRIDFLLDACRRIRQLVPDFEAIFMGAGVDSEKVATAAGATPWLHYLGPRFGDEKVRFATLGQVMLMPGLVGLAVLDAFALGVPMITTAVPDHSPEIEYLEHDVNGLMLPGGSSPQAYAEAVAGLLLDEPRRERLRQGCLRAREQYSIEEMVTRFADGVERALAD